MHAAGLAEDEEVRVVGVHLERRNLRAVGSGLGPLFWKLAGARDDTEVDGSARSGERAAANGGKNPAWTSYEKLRNVIEKRMFSQVEDLLPVISFESKKDNDTQLKHDDFVARMLARLYTERQVRRLVGWYMRVNKAG